MDTSVRGNYDSGEDFVLEYGELRFTFNERDFSERCEQAGRKLGFVGGTLEEPELEDLVNLAVNGEIQEPASALGEHVNDCWPELVGPADRSLVHWLRRLVFRSAWLDQRVKEGELDVRFDDRYQTFSYVQPDRGNEPVELAPEPSWGRVAYIPRSRGLKRPSGRAFGAACPPGRTYRPGRPAPSRGSSGSPSPCARRRAPRCAACGWRPRRAPGASPRRRPTSAMTVVSPPTGSRPAATIVSVPPSGTLRAAARARRASPGGKLVERVDDDGRVTAAGDVALGGVDDAVDRLGLRVRDRRRASRRPRASARRRPTRAAPPGGRRRARRAPRRPPGRRARRRARAAWSCGRSRTRRRC